MNERRNWIQSWGDLSDEGRHQLIMLVFILGLSISAVVYALAGR